MSVFDKVMSEFHDHAQGCTRCEQHPDDICEIGKQILYGLCPHCVEEWERRIKDAHQTIETIDG